ncbi:glycosyltransferase family 1 protein, partial [Kitasatospora sp. NPDC091257]
MTPVPDGSARTTGGARPTAGASRPTAGAPRADDAPRADHAPRADEALTIVRLANFVTPVSGGLRTALRHLGAGYRAAGHRPVLIVPGERRSEEETEQGVVVT